MAKKRKKLKRVGLCRSLWRYCFPKKLLSPRRLILRYISRTGLAIASFFVSLTLLFSFLPVPFSAYMIQQKIGHLWQGNQYKIHYNWVSIDRIAWPMQIAVIASEDQLFKDHFGVDWHAIEIAMKRNAKSKRLRGGSTISQQTVKNLYLWHGQSWVRKSIELPLTFLVESVWSKERVLEIYLNIAEFGDGIFGVEAAAQHYFKKSANQLTQQEAALLAAVLPNPIIFKVNRPSPLVRNRQQWILRQINNLGGKAYLEQL